MKPVLPLAGQRMVKWERPAPAELVAPDEGDRGAAWWLENVEGPIGKLARPHPAPPPKPEEVLVASTQEQFDLLQTAVDAVDANAGFERAENTESSYGYEWRSFVRWCVARGQKVMPASPAAVKAYIADISSRERPRNVKATTVGKPRAPDAPPIKALPPRKPGGLVVALSAIRYYHVKHGYPSPHDSELVQDELQRIRRRVGVAPTRKLPLTVAHIDQIVALLEAERASPPGKTKLERRASARRAVRDKALLLVGFAGGFRRSELGALAVPDVFLKAGGLDATVKWSKTDQTGAGHVKAIPVGREGTCPKRALEAWLTVASIDDEGPIFREIDRFDRLVLNRGRGRRAVVGLTGNAVALVVKARLEQAGIDPARYSGHSLRAGLITAAYEAGKSVAEIMATTGHRNPNTVYLYVRSGHTFQNAASAGLL